MNLPIDKFPKIMYNNNRKGKVRTMKWFCVLFCVISVCGRFVNSVDKVDSPHDIFKMVWRGIEIFALLGLMRNPEWFL